LGSAFSPFSFYNLLQFLHSTQFQTWVDDSVKKWEWGTVGDKIELSFFQLMTQSFVLRLSEISIYYLYSFIWSCFNLFLRVELISNGCTAFF
jgi:hypothetical protein